MGGRPGRPVTACSWTETESPRSVLEKMQDRLHNETWSLDDEKLSALMQLMRPWTEENFPDLDKEEVINWEFCPLPNPRFGCEGPLSPAPRLSDRVMADGSRLLLALRSFQLTLPRVAAGWCFALLTSNFNRIAIYELGIAAVVVTSMLGFYHFPVAFPGDFTAALPIERPCSACHRTPYIFFGLMLSACAVAALPYVVVLMAQTPNAFYFVAFPYASYVAGFLVLILFWHRIRDGRGKSPGVGGRGHSESQPWHSDSPDLDDVDRRHDRLSAVHSRIHAGTTIPKS